MLEYMLIICFCYLLLVAANALRTIGDIKMLYYACQIIIFGMLALSIMFMWYAKDTTQTIQHLRNMPECYEVVVD